MKFTRPYYSIYLQAASREVMFVEPIAPALATGLSVPPLVGAFVRLFISGSLRLVCITDPHSSILIARKAFRHWAIEPLWVIWALIRRQKSSGPARQNCFRSKLLAEIEEVKRNASSVCDGARRFLAWDDSASRAS